MLVLDDPKHTQNALSSNTN